LFRNLFWFRSGERRSKRKIVKGKTTLSRMKRGEEGTAPGFSEEKPEGTSEKKRGRRKEADDAKEEGGLTLKGEGSVERRGGGSQERGGAQTVKTREKNKGSGEGNLPDSPPCAEAGVSAKG